MASRSRLSIQTDQGRRQRQAWRPAPKQIRNRNDEELEAARDDVRVFVFFMDDYHVRKANSMSVRTPLIRFIQQQLRPTDMIGIMYPLMPVSDLLLTRDHEKIANAINTFDGRKFDYTPRNIVEQNYARYSTDQVDRFARVSWGEQSWRRARFAPRRK